MAAELTLRLVNCQRRDPVPTTRLRHLAQRVAQRLKFPRRGELAVTFIDSRAMVQLNQRWMKHRGLTDVLSFRYDGPGPVIGDILIAPAAARQYAAQHGLSYQEELARYLVHGLLHWVGHEDRTPAQQRRMRRLEDQLLQHNGAR